MLKAGLIALALLALSSEARAATPQSNGCLFAFTGQPGMPSFETYPAAELSGTVKPPRIASKDARLFRTQIIGGASAGANFGGHYTIVGWGCGSSCVQWALVDRLTGSVLFDRRFSVVSTVHVKGIAPEWKAQSNFNALRFKPGSNLLVIQGAPNEDERRDGLTFLDWTGRAFRLVAFVPAADLCS